MTDEAAQTVSVGRLAAVLDLTERRVQQLAAEGRIPKSDHGRYPFDECVRAYVRFLSRGDVEVLEDFNTARARKMSADADLAEMAAEERRGELVDAQAVAHEARNVFVLVRARMLAVSQRLVPRILGETDRRAMKEAIDEEIAEALVSLADGDGIDDQDAS